MGRAARFQSEVLVQNIISLIQKKKSFKTYKPVIWIEGAIKLTLGKVSILLLLYSFRTSIRRLTECGQTRDVMYVKEESGKEILIPTKLGKEDMAVKKQWWIFGADASTVGRVADARAV
jgi:hypothetical protein